MASLGRAIVVLLIAVFVTGCGGCGDSTADAGEVCDPELEDEACDDEEVTLVCVADGAGEDEEMRCLHPPGAQCDDEADPDHCVPDTTCESVGEDEARCLVDEAAECDPEDDHCRSGLVCAELESGEHACHQQLVVQGVVFDAETLDAIEGAHVIAIEQEERDALSDVAITDADGHYEMDLPAVRDEQGAPVQQFFTLRASAQDYQTFPGGLRQALPIDASDHSEVDGQWVIDTAQTDVALIELGEAERDRPHISGTVDIEGGLGGVLVVAEPQGVDFEAEPEPAGYSAISARDGSFTIFNVEPDDYDVAGYIAGYQIDSEAVTVDDEDVDGVILAESEEGLQDVSGNIEIVRTEGETSVVLMVASTFNETTVRGEVPAGLRAPKRGPGDITGAWTIEGVPAGQYVIMAAFENDDLVRSPDEGIAGTDIVHIDVPKEEGEMDAGESFKVTEALETFGPGADGPEGLTERPTLRWGRIANADWYDVVVFDAFGNVVFEEDNIEHSGGQEEYTAEYDGPFDTGMYYQFRATSHRMDSPNSSTEFLRGVFYAE